MPTADVQRERGPRAQRPRAAVSTRARSDVNLLSALGNATVQRLLRSRPLDRPVSANAELQRQDDIPPPPRIFPHWSDWYFGVSDTMSDLYGMTAKDRLERAFYVMWNETSRRSFPGPTVLGDDKEVHPGRVPADKPPVFPVGVFHTHPPAKPGFVRTAVGPSPQDKTFSDTAKLPGAVIDFLRPRTNDPKEAGVYFLGPGSRPEVLPQQPLPPFNDGVEREGAITEERQQGRKPRRAENGLSKASPLPARAAVRPPFISRYESHEHIQFGEVESLLGPYEGSHTVAKGETLDSIAAKYGVASADLEKRNASQVKTWKAKSGKKIKGFSTGSVLVIPSSKTKVLGAPATLPTGAPKAKATIIKGIPISYGEMIALGDFYATAADMMNADPKELQALVDLLRKEAATPGSVSTADWEKATGGRYLKLAEANASHFGPPDPGLVASTTKSGVNHKSEWEKYHKIALDLSLQGKKDEALQTNAFGDHFLTDAFASGHIFNKEDVVESFKSKLAGKVESFFDRVAAEAWKDKTVSTTASKYETNDFAGWDINSAGRFSKVLQGVYKKMPDRVHSVVAKTVHDKLNKDGVEVENAKGDKWVTKGDAFLTKDSLEIGKKAVAQSQANVLNVAGTTGPIDFAANFKSVWEYVPRPTAPGAKTITDQVALLADPAQQDAVNAVAGLAKSYVQLIMDGAVAEGLLRKR